jgi:hypothetical protein
MRDLGILIYYRVHNLIRKIREVLTWLILRREQGRQPYYMFDVVCPAGVSVEQFFGDVLYRLTLNGYEISLWAYHDKDELVNVRKIAPVATYQYHVRVFQDEARGHYELRPDVDPIGHLDAEVFEELPDTEIALVQQCVDEAVKRWSEI